MLTGSGSRTSPSPDHDGQDLEVIYLDDNASNPLDPIVREAVVEALNDPPANASSTHANGSAAHYRIDIARESVAELVDATPSEVVFTAGATEANNLFLRGFPWGIRRSVVISATEHSSVANPARALAEQGLIELRVVPVDRHGQVQLDALNEMLDDTVAAVSIAAANSETGVINPLGTIAGLVHAAGAVFHSDATQLVGRLPLSMRQTHRRCNLAQRTQDEWTTRHRRSRDQSASSSPAQPDRFRRRPRRRSSIRKQQHRGHCRPRRRRPYRRRAPTPLRGCAKLRDQLAANLVACGGVVNGAGAARLPNTVNIRFPGALGDVVLARTPRIAASLGSACNAGAIEPSPTLLAMGLDRTAAQESIRFSVTRFTTEADISAASGAIATTVAEVRQLTQEVA